LQIIIKHFLWLFNKAIIVQIFKAILDLDQYF